MIRFNCDYGEGAHPRILQRLTETNLQQRPGYGEDDLCREAAEMLRGLCRAPEADVHFLVGGTQANLVVLAAALRPHQGVISADSGHIAAHETGAVEATGHKVLTIESADGKLRAEDVERLCRAHKEDDAREHMAMPAALYISNPTELGTIYTRAELLALRAVCDRHGLFFYLDGARLGYGLAAPTNDLTLPFLAEIADTFTIGGTKQGALLGEAAVLLSPALKRDFRYILKQRGGLLAKGFLLGLQFSELFRDGLYFELSRHAIGMAASIRAALLERGIPLLVDSPTNQLFPILADAQIARLGEKYSCAFIKRMDDAHCAIRLCTSWATRAEDVRALIDDIGRI